MTRLGRADQWIGDDIATRPQHICFFFNAQIHQLLHALPIAIELSRNADFRVEILASTDAHLGIARELAVARHADRLIYRRIESGWLSLLGRMSGSAIPPKLPALLAARRALAGYDAIVVPERTSLLLRKMGLGGMRFIHTCHGAGDRAVGYDRRIRQFDFVLLAGEKQRQRMLEEGLIREGHYAVAGYCKFDLARRSAPAPIFANQRPIILYNPHFSRKLSSWFDMGEDIIRQFAEDDRFNLIVAPHIRLFDNRRQRARIERKLAAFAHHPAIHIDFGSRASIDMSYVHMASMYLGDVSSQIYEFIAEPRPCAFLNPHRAAWQNNRNYAHWNFGPVHASADGIVASVADAIERHPAFRPIQQRAVRRTFDDGMASPSVRGAAILANYLRRSSRRASLGPTGAAQSRLEPLPYA